MSNPVYKCIAHVAFNCKDLEKQIAFYHDILGCEQKFVLTYGQFAAHLEKQALEAGKPVPESVAQMRTYPDRHWIVYMQLADCCFIELFDQEGAFRPNVPGPEDLNYTHLAIEVNDIHAWQQAIIDRGGEDFIESPPSMGLDNTWQMWLHDTEGNRFEFMEYTPDSFQLAGK